MKSHRRNTLPYIAIGAFALLALASCTKSGENLNLDVENAREGRGSSGVLSKKPVNPKSQDAQLGKRWEDQTQFLNWHQELPNFRAIPMAATREMKGGSPAKREIKYSDVYAIGPKGEKTVILLNNIGGLQIVKYPAGDPKNPVLLGEVEATYNNPRDLYFDPATKYAYVLENYYVDQRLWYARNRNSRVLVYDLRNPAAPAIVNKEELTGELADSRMVGSKDLGEVLYVVTQQYPHNWWSASASSYTGRVYSLRLSGKNIAHATEQRGYRLGGKVRTWRRNLNVVEDGDKFYLIAALESGWREPSVLEVFDISDPGGRVDYVMTAHPMGQIGERTNTFVKNNTLIVVNEFIPKEPGGRGNRQNYLAVQAFDFPTDATKPVTQEEVDWKLKRIDYELARIANRTEVTKDKDGKDKEYEVKDFDSQYEKIIANKEYGVKGKFVQTDFRRGFGGRPDTYRLHKFASDRQDFIEPIWQVVNRQRWNREKKKWETIEVETLLSPNLQDVRVGYEDQEVRGQTYAMARRLYVLWQPQDSWDPLEVYDISQIENKLVHVGHTEFEGFVTRAFPIRHEYKRGKFQDYLIGLGHKQNEWSTPIAYLFKIDETKNGVSAPLAAQLDLEDDIRASFNTQEDKEIAAPKIAADGTGTILFKIYQYKKGDEWTYLSGAQLLGIDLSKAPAGDDKVEGLAKGVFTQGAYLATSDADALKRAFANPELENGYNAFNDREFGTFIIEGAGESKKIVAATSILELTRTIQAYETVGKGRSLKGVQIVNFPRKNTMEVRIASANHADQRLAAQKDKQMPRFPISSGKYGSHLVDGNILYVLSTKYENIPPRYKEGPSGLVIVDPGGFFNILKAHKLDLSGAKPKLLSSVQWREDVPQAVFPWGRGGPFLEARSARISIWPWWRPAQVKTELVNFGGKIVANVGGKLTQLDLSNKAGKIINVDTKSCTLQAKVENPTQVDPAETKLEISDFNLKIVDGALLATYKELVKDPNREVFEEHYLYKNQPGGMKLPEGWTLVKTIKKHENYTQVLAKRPLKFARNFLSEASLKEADGKVSLECRAPVNIPGTVIAYYSDKETQHIVTDDTRVIHIDENKYGEHSVNYSPRSRRALTALNVGQPLDAKNKVAMLKSLYDPGDIDLGAMKRVNARSVAFVESEAYGGSELVVLSVDEKLKFNKDYISLDLDIGQRGTDGSQYRLAAVVNDSVQKDADKDAYLAVVRVGRKAQVVRFVLDKNYDFSGNVDVQDLRTVSLNGKKSADSVKSFNLLNSRVYLFGYGSIQADGASHVHFTEDLRSLEVSLEQFGLRQLFIED